MSGVRKEAVNAATTAVNAAPMTTATARSTTLPRSTKSLKPLSMRPSWRWQAHGQRCGGGHAGESRRGALVDGEHEQAGVVARRGRIVRRGGGGGGARPRRPPPPAPPPRRGGAGRAPAP